MLFSNTLLFFSTGVCVFARLTQHIEQHANEKQDVLVKGTAKVKRIAVIGAGAAGASASYHLARFAKAAGIRTNITIFERSPYIGGRSTTVNAYNATNPPPESIVELGASIFVEINSILVNATNRFNLTTANFNPPPSSSSPALGIYNGEEFVFTQSSGVWDTVKLFWRYGLAPIKTNNLMKDVVGRFLQMYETGSFPFASLSREAGRRGLSGVVAATGEQWLKENGVSDLFAREIVQASTRVNYAQNLPLIHGLETMVCMAINGAMSIEGGNWQIFDKMVKHSTRNIRLSTEVTSITKDGDGTCYVGSRATSSEADAEAEQDEVFDTVILAAPFQFSSIKIDPAPKHVPDEIPYVKLHVTLFTSPHSLAPAAFNLGPEENVPHVVLTTLLPSEHPGTNPIYAGKAGFYSISTMRQITNPKTGVDEFLYKIFSPNPITAQFLARILGVSASQETSELAEKDVSWIYRKLWNSYPYEYPRVTFDELRLDTDLWYTSGIESFISTMETSALMGMNVARLIVDEWATGKKDPYFVESLKLREVPVDKSQNEGVKVEL